MHTFFFPFSKEVKYWPGIIPAVSLHFNTKAEGLLCVLTHVTSNSHAM